MENGRLAWELEQLQGVVDLQELHRLRSDLHTLRQEMLNMATRLEASQVCKSDATANCAATRRLSSPLPAFMS